MDGSRLKELFTSHASKNGARENGIPYTTPEYELDEYEEFAVDAAAGGKHIEGLWVSSVKRKDWETQSWVWAEDMMVCKELGD